MNEEIYIIGPDGKTVISRLDEFRKQGICFTCRMKHQPYCDDGYVACRNCLCAKEWHPMDGPYRVGSETEFTMHNCYCQGYEPLDNLEYLEWKLEKKETKVDLK